ARHGAARARAVGGGRAEHRGSRAAPGLPRARRGAPLPPPRERRAPRRLAARVRAARADRARSRGRSAGRLTASPRAQKLQTRRQGDTKSDGASPPAENLANAPPVDVAARPVARPSRTKNPASTGGVAR